MHKKRILFENEDLIIVDKPEDTIVHGEPGDLRTLLEQVKEHLEIKSKHTVQFLAPANRLDRNTKGPVVFAKSKKMAGQLRRLFSQCKVNKIYHAQITGALEKAVFVEADIIQGSHTRVTVKNLKCHYESFPDKQEWFHSREYDSDTFSGTLIKPLNLSADGESTLVEIHPWTGRKHQIRVICQEIGHRIVGDKKYNRVIRSYKRSGKKTDGPFTIPALICYTLTIPDLKISVRTRYQLGNG